MDFEAQSTNAAQGGTKDVSEAPAVTPLTPKQVIDEFNAVYKRLADMTFMLNQLTRIVVNHSHDHNGKVVTSVNHLLQELGALDAQNKQARKG